MILDNENQKKHLLFIAQSHVVNGSYTGIRETIAIIDNLIVDISSAEIAKVPMESAGKEAKEPDFVRDVSNKKDAVSDP